MRRCGNLVAGLTVAMLAAGGAWAQENGVYSEEQAQRGMVQFQSQCAGCHGRQLEGVEAPALSGADFRGNWGTAGGVHGYFSVAMPPQAPGQLGEDVYLDILAYILEENGVPPGTEGLTSDPALLESINLVALSVAAEEPAANVGATPVANNAQTTPAGGASAQAAPGGNAATPAAGAAAAQTPVPQAYTWGKELPSVEPAQPAGSTQATAPAQSGVPQAYTWGKTLPTVEAAPASGNP